MKEDLIDTVEVAKRSRVSAIVTRSPMLLKSLLIKIVSMISTRTEMKHYDTDVLAPCVEQEKL